MHEAIKLQLVECGVDRERIQPAIGATGPELKLAGFLKMKDQDVCVFPKNIGKQSRVITWGPLQFKKEVDPNGFEYTEKTLAINLRSQLTSLQKNVDTLFERTFAEPMNLHIIYPRSVLGEVFLVPVYQYKERAMINNRVRFESTPIDVVKYISFFSALNGRRDTEKEMYKYERCALLLVDFRKKNPKIYLTKSELIKDGLLQEADEVDFDSISIENFVKDIISIYKDRFGDIKDI